MINTKLEFAYIKLCFDNPEFWALKYTPIDAQVEWIVEQVYKYRDKYNKYPTLDTLLSFIECSPQQLKYIEDAFKVEINEEYTLSTVLKFVEEYRFKKGLIDADYLMTQGNLEEAKSVVIRSMEMVYNLPVDYFADSVEDTIETVSTGYPCLDKPLGGGGHRKNFMLIIGPSGIGKSVLMLNMGALAVESSLGVVHLTLENSLAQTKERYRKRFEVRGRPTPGNLHIQEFPTGGATVADFDAIVNGYRPDLVVIDYLNEVSAGVGSGNTSRDLGDVARGMRSIAQRYNTFVVTAQQGPKHKRLSEVDVTAEDGFWSYEPTQVADSVITMNQTKAEKANGELRLSLEKNRNGIDKKQWPFKVDYANMLIEEVSM